MEPLNGRTLIRWYFEDVLSKGDLSSAETFIAEDVIFHPLGLKGRSAFLNHVRGLRTAFPDLSFRVNDEISTSAQAAARFTMSGTHLGEFGDIPATGKRFEVEGMDFLHLKHEQITAIWVSLDSLDWMRQLGVVNYPAKR